MIRRIRTQIAEGLQTKVLSSGKTPATANRYLATLNRMTSKVVEREMVGEDALKRVRRAKFLAENIRRHRR